MRTLSGFKSTTRSFSVSATEVEGEVGQSDADDPPAGDNDAHHGRRRLRTGGAACYSRLKGGNVVEAAPQAPPPAQPELPIQ
jgi:hypothetical protein